MKILVTGATGNLGALVVQELLKIVPAESIAVSVRDPQKAEHLSAQGIEVRQGDFNDYHSLVSAFTGIDRLLIISTDDLQNRVNQQAAAVKAAKEANVSFIAYTSAPNAPNSKLVLAKSHSETEEVIKESGIPYSFLRNNWYLENEMATFQSVLQGGPWVIATGEAKIGWASRRDFAEAAARVLTGEGHENTVYELSGTPLTQEELANIFAEAMNRDVQVQYVDLETYSKMLSSTGMPEAVIGLLVSLQKDIGDGELNIESDDLEKLLGHPTTPLKTAFQELLS